jgi:hypothetical protein
LLFFHLYCWLGSKPTGEPTGNNLMVGKAETKTFCYSSGGALLVSHCPPLQCLAMVGCFVASSAKQKQQRHHQQLNNGSTILYIYVSRKLGLI